jgi:hypothetical protein
MRNLLAAFDQYFTGKMETIHTVLPGKIVAYSAGTRLASVQVTIRLRTQMGLALEIPVLEKIPVVFPASSAFSLDFPLNPDDPVLLLVSEADLASWIQNQGKMSTAKDSLKFSLSSGFCLPGLMFAGNPKGSIAVGADGTLTINGHLEVKP